MPKAAVKVPSLYARQHRFITVLSLVVDSLVPDGAESTTRLALSRQIDICLAHGGTVNHITGNVMTCLFGADAPSEDHAFHALSAAETMLADTHRMREHHPAEAWHIRIGISSGDVDLKPVTDVAHGPCLVMGDTVSIAERVARAAQADAILLDARCAQALDKFFTFTRVASLAWAGNKKIGVFKKASTEPAIIKMQTRAIRASLIADIRGALLKRGELAPVWLQGDAGIGKSFIAGQVLRDMGADGIAQVIRLSFYPQPVTDPGSIERRILGAIFAADHAQLAEAADKLSLGDIGDSEIVRDCMADILGADVSAASSYAMLDAASKTQMRRSVTAAALRGACAGKRPALLCEDMHWASDDETQTIGAILAQISGRDFPAVIFTSRQKPAVDVFPAERLRVFNLLPLSHSQTEKLLTSLLGQYRLPKEAMARLHALSSGNPYFLKEYCSWIKGALRGGTPLEDVLDLINSDMPGEVAGILQTRLTRLGQEALTLAKAASIQGLRIDLDMLAAMSGLSRDEIMPLLMQVQSYDIMRQRDTGAGIGWEFSHEIMQRAIYASIPAAQRRTLHGVAMRHIRTTGAAGTQAFLAYHARHAALPKYDYIYSKWAARHAMAQSQHETALRHIALAHKALGRVQGVVDRPRHTAALKFMEIGSLFIVSRYAAAKTRIKHVLAARGQLPGTHVIKQTLSYQGLMHWINGEIPKAAQIYAALLKNNPPQEDPALSLRESARLSHIYIDMGQYHKAVAYAEQAMALLESRDPYAKYGLLTQMGPTLLSCLALAHTVLGNEAAARRCHEQATALLAASKDYFTHIYTATLLGHALIEQKRFEEAVAILHTALDQCAIIQSSLLKPYILAALGLALARLGKAGEGLNYGATALDIAKKSHLQLRRPLFHLWYAESLIIDQQFGAAMPILRKAMKGAVASGEKGRLAYVYYLMTECYRQQGLQKSKDYLLFYKKARRFAVSEGAALLQERLDEMAAAA